MVSILGTGFDNINIEKNFCKFCGFNGDVLPTSTKNSLDCILPEVPTPYLTVTQKVSKKNFNLNPGQIKNGKAKIDFDLIADDMENANLIIDNKDRTYYSSPNKDTCYIGFDFQEDKKIEIQWIKFKGLYSKRKKDYKKLAGSVLQVSNDFVTW